MNRRRSYGSLLRPRIIDVLGSVPLSTPEVVDALRAQLVNEQAPSDFRGPLVEVPIERKCSHCGGMHDCSTLVPMSTGLVKPQLDALARAGHVEKISKGNAHAALWVRVDVPDTLEGLHE